MPTPASGARLRARRLLPAAALSAFCLLSSALKAEMARSADSFVDSIGVNTHFGRHWAYNLSGLKTKLRDSGIRYIRNNEFPVPSLYDGTHANKIKTLVVVDMQTMTESTIVSLLQQEDVLGIEGFNEPENFPRTWKTDYKDVPARHDFSGARASQRDYYDAAKASAAKLKPVVSPALGQSIMAGMISPTPFDKISLHSYSAGLYPGFMALDLRELPHVASMVATGQSPQGIWTTEMGFNNATEAPLSNWHRPVTQTAGGKYIPRMLALNFNRRIERTFIYELIDIGTSLSNTEHKFGLLLNNGDPKPAFNAVKNLISILGGGGTTTPGALNLTFSGDTASLNRTLLKKGNDFYLLLWREVPSCNTDVNPVTDRVVVPTQVTVNWGGATASITTYSNLANASYTTALGGSATSASPFVGDEIIILKIANLASAASGVPIPSPTLPDLVITKTKATPSEPIAGEATKLEVTVKNQGTAAGASTVKMRLDGGANDHPITFTIPALAAGESATVEGSANWTPPAGSHGYHNFALTCDATSAVTESNERNNGHPLTIPVLTSRWAHACDNFTGWTASHPEYWVVQSAGGKSYFANTSIDQWAGGKLTRVLPSALASNWKLEFDYNWRYGAAAYNLSVGADVLNSDGDGYRIRVRQGIGSDPANTGKLIQLFKVDNHVAATQPLAEGPGYNRPGADPAAANFLPVSLIFDRATQSLSVYIDPDGTGVLEQSIPPTRDTTTPTNTFHKVVLWASDEQNAECQPMFDNIRLSEGMLKLVPAPFFTDSFENLDQWTGVTNWTTVVNGGNSYVENPTSNGAGTLTYPFPTTLKNGWTLGFEYDFRTGGASSVETLKYGHNDMYVRADMLNASNQGYRVIIRQGDTNDPAKNGAVISVSRMNGGTETPLTTAKGIGYNVPGWYALGRTGPDFKRVAFTYNRQMQTLSVLIDVDRNGTMEEVVVPVQDTTYTEFSKLVLSSVVPYSWAAKPAFDNVTVGLIR